MEFVELTLFNEKLTIYLWSQHRRPYEMEQVNAHINPYHLIIFANGLDNQGMCYKVPGSNITLPYSIVEIEVHFDVLFTNKFRHQIDVAELLRLHSDKMLDSYLINVIGNAISNTMRESLEKQTEQWKNKKG